MGRKKNKEKSSELMTLESEAELCGLTETQTSILKQMQKNNRKKFNLDIENSFNNALTCTNEEGQTMADVLVSGAVAIAIEKQQLYHDLKDTETVFRMAKGNVDKKEVNIKLDINMIKDLCGNDHF